MTFDKSETAYQCQFFTYNLILFVFIFYLNQKFAKELISTPPSIQVKD